MESRVWLFGDLVRVFFIMLMIDFQASALSVGAVKARQKNVKRLDLVRSYFNVVGTPQQLRVTVLCLRLTAHAVNLTAKKTTDVPPLVRLARGEVQQTVGRTLLFIMQHLDNDILLDTSLAVIGLLITFSYIVVRFEEFNRYSSAIVHLSRRWNPDGHVASTERFLGAPATVLDAGYSLQLRQAALANEGRGAQSSHVLGKTAQKEIDAIAERAQVNSLDGERKIARDKRAESQKMVSLQRASRASIVQEYRVQRAETFRMRSKAEEASGQTQDNEHARISSAKVSLALSQGKRLFQMGERGFKGRPKVFDDSR